MENFKKTFDNFFPGEQRVFLTATNHGPKENDLGVDPDFQKLFPIGKGGFPSEYRGSKGVLTGG